MGRDQLLNDPEQAQRLILDGRLSGLWTAMPCIVQSVDLAAMTIEAQPAIQGTVEDETGATTPVNLPLLVDVPIVFPSAGGFALTFPIAAGDEVLVVFASRCIDSWWESGGFENRPSEMRMHDLSDGFAIPGPRSQPKVLPGISATNAQLRNEAGTTYLEITSDGKIKLVSPSEIDLTAPAINVNGVVVASGGVTAASLTTAGAVAAGSGTIGGVPFGTHKHTGVTTGLGNTGGPIP